MQKCININMRLQTDVLPLFRGDYKQCQGFMYPCSILDSIVMSSSIVFTKECL